MQWNFPHSVNKYTRNAASEPVKRNTQKTAQTLKQKAGGDTRPPRGSRGPANPNRKTTRQTERESERQPFKSHSQHQERRDMNHTKTGRPARGSRGPANSNGKATRQTERESQRQPLGSHSQHQERRDMNHTKTGRQCYKCGESHSTSDCRHHSEQIVASELKDPIWHSSEWQIGSFSSEATHV